VYDSLGEYEKATAATSLPASLGVLTGLQTLDLHYCSDLHTPARSVVAAGTSAVLQYLRDLAKGQAPCHLDAANVGGIKMDSETAGSGAGEPSGKQGKKRAAEGESEEDGGAGSGGRGAVPPPLSVGGWGRASTSPPPPDVSSPRCFFRPDF
jgi:hypothetical protein